MQSISRACFGRVAGLTSLQKNLHLSPGRNFRNIHVSLVTSMSIQVGKGILNINTQPAKDILLRVKETDSRVPVYDELNIQMKGYDFSVLEKFAKYVHKTADRIGLTVEDCWATPAQNFKVTQLKPDSNSVEIEYLLNLYERNVQIVEVPSTLLPVFINIIEAAVPPGVKLRAHPHLPEHTQIRYVPDLELKQLKLQLGESTREKK